eukprot:Gb_36837 [translate_table: standard]
MATLSAKRALLGIPESHISQAALKAASNNSNLLAFFRTVRRAGEYAQNAADENRESGENNIVKNAKESAKPAAEQTQSKTKEIGEKARSTAEEFSRQAKERASQATDDVESVGEEAKQKMHEAWETTKETGQKLKVTEASKSQEEKQ